MNQAQRKARKDRLMKQCDALVKQIVFAMYGGLCIRCGRPADDPMHIIGRDAKLHRWRIFNVLPGCRKCHGWFDTRVKSERLEFVRLASRPHYAYVTASGIGKTDGTISLAWIESVHDGLQNILDMIDDASRLRQ
jgi:hypothetical protein